MNILYVCHRLPFPPNRGGKIRPFNVIRHLSREHTVYVASLAESEMEFRHAAPLKEYCAELIVEVLPKSVRWLQAWQAVFSKLPSSVAYFWSRRLYGRLQHLTARKRFDIVMVHCAFVAGYVSRVQSEFRIIDFGDIDSAKWFAYSRFKAWPLSAGYESEAAKLRRYEKEVATQFDYSTVTTLGELDEFRALNAGVPCTVVPNGVDCSFFGNSSRAYSERPVIIFLGRMDYFPNIDAALYFVREIYPIVRQSLPSVELRIIGANPTRKVRSLANRAGISVTGYVPDVRSYALDAGVSIAPLRLARGTQNKILESMAMGIPVVATPEAAKGVCAVPGQHLLVADGPAAFAREVIELFRNAPLQRRLSESGRKQVEKAHGWSESMKILDSILLERQGLSSQPEHSFAV